MNKTKRRPVAGRAGNKIGNTDAIPTSTRVSVVAAPEVPKGVDAVATFIAEKSRGIENGALGAAERKAAERLMAAGVARGKPREVAAELVDGTGKSSRHVMVVGLGARRR